MSHFGLSAAITIATGCLGTGVAAQQADVDYARSVKEWTTRPEFMSPLVDHLALSTTVPSPKQVLGDHIGVPNKLHSHAAVLNYFRRLAAAAPARVHILELGKSEEGRDNVVVLISSNDNIAHLSTHRANLARLADPRGLDAASAAQLIANTKPIYHVMAGLHSSETGPSEMVMELAYRLVTEDTPLIRKIRDNVIVAISPVLDADGRDRYVQWYDRFLVNEVDDRNTLPEMPYWGKYIYHDNNRDINFAETSAKQLLKYYLEWHPLVMHDLHESTPFLYIFSGQAPQNPELDPILYSELPLYAHFEMAQLTKYGMPGVWTHNFADMWSPGFMSYLASNHNGVARFYETFGNAGASTMLRHPEEVVHRGGLRLAKETTREWYRPLPPYKEVVWSMRDNTNFMETGILSALELTADMPQALLENFYKKSVDGVNAGSAKPPYAYIIAAGQPDPTRVKFVTDILSLQGIEIGRSTGVVRVKEGVYPAGSLIVKLDQPYGRLAKTLLKIQNNFPDENLQTYDDAAWTMGLMTHTDIVEIADKSVLAVPTSPLGNDPVRGSTERAGAATYAVLDTGSVNLPTLRFRLRDVTIRITEQSFPANGQTIPAGSFLVAGSNYARLKAAVDELGLRAIALRSEPTVRSHEAPVPRVAVFSTWGSSQNVGWVRYAFDKFETPYKLIFKEQVRQGDLHAKYDVIIIPSQGVSAKDIVFDLPLKGKPLPYTRTAQYPSLGMYGSSEDIRGGMGLEGLAELRKFVELGGTLITLGNASAVPAAYGLAGEVETSAPGANFYAPGPIVSAKVRQPLNPIFYGYDKTTLPVRWATSTLFGVSIADKRYVLMEFPGGKTGVMSGFMRGAEQIKDRPAIISLPEGKGRVLMFATNPIWRWQNLGEFRMLYNAVLNWQQLGGASGVAPEMPDPGAPSDRPLAVDDGSAPTAVSAAPR